MRTVTGNLFRQKTSDIFYRHEARMHFYPPTNFKKEALVVKSLQGNTAPYHPVLLGYDLLLPKTKTEITLLRPDDFAFPSLSQPI